MTPNSRRLMGLLPLLALLTGAPAAADEIPGGSIPVPAPKDVPWDVIEDRILKGMRALDEIAPFEDKAPLWDHVDPHMQKDVTLALERLKLADDARRKRLAVVLSQLIQRHEAANGVINIGRPTTQQQTESTDQTTGN